MSQTTQISYLDTLYRPLFYVSDNINIIFYIPHLDILYRPLYYLTVKHIYHT